MNLQHFGIDWIAMVLTFFAIHSLGNKKRYGFLIMMTGNACWVTLGLWFQSWGMVTANLVFFGMNVRRFFLWARPAAPPAG